MNAGRLKQAHEAGKSKRYKMKDIEVFQLGNTRS